jgi:hypothetical protein
MSLYRSSAIIGGDTAGRFCRKIIVLTGGWEGIWQLRGNAHRALAGLRAVLFGAAVGLLLSGCAGDVPVPFVNADLPPAGPGPAPEYPNVGAQPNAGPNQAPVMTDMERQAVEDQLKKLVADRENSVKRKIDSSN